MNELLLDRDMVSAWFEEEQVEPYVRVNVPPEVAAALADRLAQSLRRFYITDEKLQERASATGRSRRKILAAKLPDRGSTMAGDFGEFACFLYQATRQYPSLPIGPKKWRLKQDRTKPAPHSDVVHFVLPGWPAATDQDIIVCSEVKTKSTDADSTPIKSAIEDSAKDRTSRLAKTLVWLRDRALGEDLPGVDIDQLERFINADKHPAATRRFLAVAVICASLVPNELADAPAEPPSDYIVVVMSVPNLKETYEQVFDAALTAVEDG